MSTQPAKAHYDDVVIVGGGFAGLAAAWYLQKHDTGCTLIEASEKWGGKVQTERTTIEGHELVIEFGPDGFITRKPWALELAHDLGLEQRVVAVNKLPERIYILNGGELHPMPDGLQLLVPTKFMPFLRSPLFTFAGKMRMLAEMLIPRKSDNADESLTDFITRRLGREALHKLAEPLLSGVYNAEPDQQSILATFPNFRKIEAEHGSMIRGMRKLAVRRANASSNAVQKPALVSLKGGMGEFVDTLVNELVAKSKTQMLIQTRVQRIEQQANEWRVTLDDGETIHAKAVILAVPAPIAADIVQTPAPESAKLLQKIRYEGIASMTLAYRVEDVPRPLDAYGMVIPSTEGRQIDGMQWASAKWDNRAPDHLTLIRVFFGGPFTRDMLKHDDDTLLTMVRDELRDILGIDAAPVYHSMRRLDRAYPQYDVGHLDLVEQITESLPEHLYVLGSPYHGVGLPDITNAAKQTAQTVAQKMTSNNLESIEIQGNT